MITGFTRTKIGGTFDATDIAALFAAIRARLAAASIQESADTVFRFGPAGATPGQDTDDTPFWRFENDSINGLVVQTYIGEPGGAMGAQATHYNGFEPVLRPDVRNTVHFACSPAEGWWWLAARDSQNPGTGRVIAACRMRRVAADMTVGLYPRFGLVTVDGNGAVFNLPYATSGSGSTLGGGAQVPAASPLGLYSATRPNGSALPEGIAPLYPVPLARSPFGQTQSPAIFGDADCAMMATDGFLWGEEAAPGWRVFGYNPPEGATWLALRSPAAFDTLA